MKIPAELGTKSIRNVFTIARRWHERSMADDGVFPLLQRPLPIWMLLLFAALPAVVAGVRQRQMTPWYFYGFGCALFAWPLVVVPALHALLIRPRFVATLRQSVQQVLPDKAGGAGQRYEHGTAFWLNSFVPSRSTLCKLRDLSDGCPIADAI